ncbi:hypothetical protein [uncultured Ruegeria sp.]|uniref:hypothetical protein n=1 Tax=uncultured Ruegeria sp. TaxID=259304 RepID=UPI00260294D5|nr:hypothetical protein [uncultured Ruegeria sp.]
MSGLTNEARAVKYINAFEDAGKTIRKVVVEGKRVEIEFVDPDEGKDEFDKLDMRIK